MSIKFIQSTILFICILLTTSCATTATVKDKTSEAFFPDNRRLDFSMEGGAKIYIDAKKYLSEIMVNVGPNQALETKPKALFMPLGLLENQRDHVAISQGVSRILWQQLLAEQAFQVLEFSTAHPPYTLENVLPMAKYMGADFVVGGYITYYLDGASVGDSKIGLQWEIYDTNTGALLWSISQSGILPYKHDRDNIIFTTHYRMPINSMSTLIAAMGAEMANFLHYWTDPSTMSARDAEDEKTSGPSAFGKY